MTVIVDGTNGLTFPDVSIQATSATNATNISSGTLPFARLPTGSVLQVVQATATNQPSVSSSTFTATGLSASITPKFSTSKILIIYSGAMYITSASGQSFTTVYRGGTNLNSAGFTELSTFINGWVPANFTYLDSPSTTSSTTYAIYMKAGSGIVYAGGDGIVTSLTLMEIAA